MGLTVSLYSFHIWMKCRVCKDYYMHVWGQHIRRSHGIIFRPVVMEAKCSPFFGKLKVKV